MKNYKIVRLQGIGYEMAHASAAAHLSSLAEPTYASMHKELKVRSIVYTSGFSSAMVSLGNYADEIFFDCELLQKTWARENSVRFSGRDW